MATQPHCAGTHFELAAATTHFHHTFSNWLQEEIQTLEQRVESAQAAVQAAHARRTSTQAHYEETADRLNKATAGYIRFVQQRLAATGSNGTEPHAPTPPFPSAKLLADPVSRALLASQSMSADSVFSPEAAAVSSSARALVVPCGSSRAIHTYTACAPLSLAACKAHSRHKPRSAGAADAEPALADAVDQFKDSAAAERSVATSDICWFLQSCYRVDGGPAAPCGIAAEGPDAAAAPCISFSSTFASHPCRLSFLVFFLAMSLEVALLTAEEDGFESAYVAADVATGAYGFSPTNPDPDLKISMHACMYANRQGACTRM